MSVNYLINQVRRQHATLAQQAAKTQAEYQQSYRIGAENYANELISKIYQEMRQYIYLRCGVDLTEDCIYLIDNRLKYCNKIEIETFTKFIHNHTGLEASIDPKEPTFLTIQASGELKNYTTIDGTYLDFTALIAENTKRIKLWHQFLPSFTDQTIDKCKDYIERLPSRFYGISDVTPIYSEVISPFVGTFHFYGTDISYHRLSFAQRASLIANMTKRTSHGIFTIPDDHLGPLYISIKRAPKHQVPDPYFDFQEFCKKYDELTPESTALLQQFVDQLTFPSIEAQIATLRPCPKLTYIFQPKAEPSYDLFSSKLTYTSPLYNNLVSIIQSTHPSLQVGRFEFKPAAIGLLPRNVSELTWTAPRLEISVQYRDRTDRFLTDQVKAERTISYIKHRKVQYIANHLIQNILDYHVNQAENSIDELFSQDYPWFQLADDWQIIPLNGKVAGHTIDMRAIDDDEFLRQLEKTVDRRTKGLIQLDLDSLCYKLRPYLK